MAEQLYRVRVRVGNHWVPAHLGALTRTEAERLMKAYAANRPTAHTDVEMVKEKTSGKVHR